MKEEYCCCANGYIALECPTHGVGESPLMRQYQSPALRAALDGTLDELYAKCVPTDEGSLVMNDFPGITAEVQPAHALEGATGVMAQQLKCLSGEHEADMGDTTELATMIFGIKNAVPLSAGLCKHCRCLFVEK